MSVNGKSMLHPAFHYNDEDHNHYEKYGYCIFEHFISDEALGNYQQHAERAIAETQDGYSPEAIVGSHQLGERWLWDLANEPRLVDMIVRQVGANVVLWATQLICKPPHTGQAIRWHQDAPYWNVSGGLSGGIWIALDDLDSENGTMSVLSGWHNRGKLPAKRYEGEYFQLGLDFDALPDDIEQAQVTYELKAGQMATHHTMIPHGSTPNDSDRWRRAIILRYMAAEGEMGSKQYQDYRTGEWFSREFFLVRGEDVLNRGLKRSPF
jgi:ectoine hydroxylase-related dioxygenase (phytanoyl-CoA dioxygenase family)